MKAAVISTPESGTVKLKSKSPRNININPVQTRAAARGQQAISPRTSKPPIIKAIDKNFRTIVARNFND